jgi:hypothetical protein
MRKTEILDCSSQSHIEVIELYDCPGIKKIEFGKSSMKTSRNIRIGGKWSGSIQIEGSINSLEYVSKKYSQSMSIGHARSTIDPLLRIGENGLITNSIDEIIAAQGKVDDILYLCDKNGPNHIEIGSIEELPFRHLGICGPSNLESLTIHCLDGGAQSITLQNLPNLKSIQINGQTKMLETIFCPKLKFIHGQGHLLRVKSSASSSINLSIGGIWSQVETPGKFSVVPPTREEIYTCSDISWVHIPSLSYEIQVKWAEKFGLDISQVMEGIPIQEMIAHLETLGDDIFEMIEDWTLWLLTPSEQYIAMRLITALCVRGIDKESIWKARGGVLTSNNKFNNSDSEEPPIQRFSRTFRTQNLPATIKNWYQIPSKEIRDVAEARRGFGIFTWSSPQRSWASTQVLPFNRLDFEIWVETGGVGQELLPQHVIESAGYNRQTIMYIIHGILDWHDDENSRNRQEEILAFTLSLFDTQHPILSDIGLIDSIAEIICTHGVEKNQRLVDQFIQSVFVDQHHINPGMIAIAAALMQYLDDIRLQSLMMKHRSSPEIGRAEAKALHALSLAGRRAYTQGRIPPLEWPASKNWRNRYDK